MKEKNKKPVFLFLHFSLMFHYQNHLPSIHVSPKTHEIMRTGVCVSVYEWGERGDRKGGGSCPRSRLHRMRGPGSRTD